MKLILNSNTQLKHVFLAYQKINHIENNHRIPLPDNNYFLTMVYGFLFPLTLVRKNKYKKFFINFISQHTCNELYLKTNFKLNFMVKTIKITLTIQFLSFVEVIS